MNAITLYWDRSASTIRGLSPVLPRSLAPEHIGGYDRLRWIAGPVVRRRRRGPDRSRLGPLGSWSRSRPTFTPYDRGPGVPARTLPRPARRARARWRRRARARSGRRFRWRGGAGDDRRTCCGGCARADVGSCADQDRGPPHLRRHRPQERDPGVDDAGAAGPAAVGDHLHGRLRRAELGRRRAHRRPDLRRRAAPPATAPRARVASVPRWPAAGDPDVPQRRGPRRVRRQRAPPPSRGQPYGDPARPGGQRTAATGGMPALGTAS